MMITEHTEVVTIIEDLIMVPIVADQLMEPIVRMQKKQILTSLAENLLPLDGVNLQTASAEVNLREQELLATTVAVVLEVREVVLVNKNLWKH